jgi:lysophospholipase L1-like esterase
VRRGVDGGGLRAAGAGWSAARGLLYSAPVALLVASGVEPSSERYALLVHTAFAGCLACGAAVALLARGHRGMARRIGRGPWRTLDLLCANALLALVVAELALLLWARLAPSPLLAADSDAARRIEALRLEPGQPYLGFRANSGGYHDEAFFAGGSDDLVIAVLADSFGVGIVPYDHNVVTVAEQILSRRLGDIFERVALHNFGVSGIGMNGYAHLLETEVLPLGPDFVVLCVFVGNDVHLDAPFGASAARPRTALRNWLVALTLRRLLALVRERAVGAGSADPSPERRPGTPPLHVLDPSGERPTYSEAAFLQIERRRLEVCRSDDARIDAAFEALFRGLERFHARLGERLLVVAIPDEFQVDDELWAGLVGTSAGRYERDLPQQRIGGFCREKGIPVLDLLPVLREAKRSWRPYHLRDTHWNAYGNRVAGRALAAALEELVRAAASRELPVYSDAMDTS